MGERTRKDYHVGSVSWELPVAERAGKRGKVSIFWVNAQLGLGHTQEANRLRTPG